MLNKFHQHLLRLSQPTVQPKAQWNVTVFRKGQPVYKGRLSSEIESNRT